MTVKDLKFSMDHLEKKVDERDTVEIKDIIKQQEVIEKVWRKSWRIIVSMQPPAAGVTPTCVIAV